MSYSDTNKELLKPFSKHDRRRLRDLALRYEYLKRRITEPVSPNAYKYLTTEMDALEWVVYKALHIRIEQVMVKDKNND